MKYREYINKLKEGAERELVKNEYGELRKDERFWIGLLFTAMTVMLAITKILGSTWSILFAIIYLAFYVPEIHRVETNIKELRKILVDDNEVDLLKLNSLRVLFENKMVLGSIVYAIVAIIVMILIALGY